MASGSGLAAIKALKKEEAGDATVHGAGGVEIALLRPNPPLQLKNFHIMTTLGTGTFGRVRLVKNLADNSTLALKIMKKRSNNSFESIGSRVVRSRSDDAH